MKVREKSRIRTIALGGHRHSPRKIWNTIALKEATPRKNGGKIYYHIKILKIHKATCVMKAIVGKVDWHYGILRTIKVTFVTYQVALKT